MKESKFKKITKKHISEYINNIAIELESPHNQWFENFGFPLFGETSKEYHEQVYFQSYLESYTRKMINGILQEVTNNEVPDRIIWPELEFNGIYNGYTNVECENKFAFQFINVDKKIGYRYSDFKHDDIEELLKAGNVEHIVLILWEGEDEIVASCYEDSRIRIVLFKELFTELFYETPEDIVDKMYDMFVKKITRAVEQAKAMISLRTIPGFTPMLLHNSRARIEKRLRDDVLGLTCFRIKNSNFKYVENNSKFLFEKYNLADRFLAHKFELAFVGTTHYAKCYLTSEYLFHYFENNPMFDYTPIVSGYLKSIEQLLYEICFSYFTKTGDERRAKNLKSRTLGDYETILENNALIFNDTIRQDKDIIIDCLKSYRIESRNHLFHKDYFSDWKRVEKIRENTLFLYVAIMTATDTALIRDCTLGILDQHYDRLFNILDNSSYKHFTFELDGNIYSGFEKQNRMKGLIFDKNGLITNTVTFIKYDCDRYDEIEISRKNMPSAMWSSTALGNKETKIW